MSRNVFAWAVIAWLVSLCIVVCVAVIGAREQEQAVDAVASTPPAAVHNTHTDADMMLELPTLPKLPKEKLPVKQEQPQHLYTEADAVALAKMAWGECRGVGTLLINGKEVTGTCQKAAVIWCALNRYDAGFEDSIAEVVTAPMQFVGYAVGNPVDPELLALVYDVLERWEQERLHGGDVGRALPADCMWFVGDGQHNWFVNEWKSAQHYAWTLPDPYASK